MKKYQKYLFGTMCLVALGISAGTFMKVNAASDAVTVARRLDLCCRKGSPGRSTY